MPTLTSRLAELAAARAQQRRSVVAGSVALVVGVQGGVEREAVDWVGSRGSSSVEKYAGVC